MNAKTCLAVLATACLSLVSAPSHAVTPAELSSIEGLTIWLDASDIAGNGSPTENGARIGTWMDKASGIGFTNQGDDGSKPTLAAGAIGRKPAVHFVRPSVDTAQYLSGDSGTVGALFNNRNTAFVVARANNGCGDNDSQDPQYIFAREGCHSGLGFGGYPNATQYRSYRWFNGNGSAIDMKIDGYTQGDAVMITRIVDGNTSAGPSSVTLAVNNEVIATESSSNYFHPQGNTLRLGCAFTSGSWCGGFDGDIAELLVYSRVLSESEQDAVFGYLQRRYNLPGGFQVSNLGGGTDYTGGTAVKVARFPAVDGYDQYQAAEGPADTPDPDAWAAIPASVAAFPAIAFTIPADGDTLFFRAWLHDSSGSLPDLSYDAQIIYTASTPTIVVRNVSLMTASNGRRTIDPADVDYGSSDPLGIVSRSVSPAVIVEGENTVTFTAVNAAGNSASEVVTVTGTQFIPHEEISSVLSLPLPQGRLDHLLHLGADFDNDYINTNVGGVGGIDNDQLSTFGGQANIKPMAGDIFKSVPGATTADGNMVWTEMKCPSQDGAWTPTPDRSNYIKYWHVYIFVPGTEDRDVVFRHNNDDELRVWVNGGDPQVSHNGAGGEFTTNGKLYAGLNSVTIKLKEGGGGDYMAIRITDPNGAYFTDLTYQFSPYLFSVADPRTGSADFTSATELNVLGVPKVPNGSDYQVTLSDDPSSLDEAGWTYFDQNNPPATLALPFTASGTEYTVAFWTRSYTDGIVTTNCEATTITYSLAAPTAIAKDASIAIDSTRGTAIDPALIDDGSFDNVSGIHSLSVDPPVVYGPGQVELVVVNNAGIEDRATATISASGRLDCHVATTGDDANGTGRPEAPWRTITHALSQLQPGGTVYLADGTYDAAGGETFPLPALGYSLAAEPTAVGMPVIDGGNTIENIFVLGTGSLNLSGLWLRNSTNAIIKVIGSSAGNEAVINAEDCRFTQSYANGSMYGAEQGDGKYYYYGNVGILDTWTPANATFDRCEITEIDRYAVFAAVDYASTLELNDCLVQSNKVTRGVFCSYRSNAPACFNLTLNRDRFIGNRCRFLDDPGQSGYVHDCAESAITYHVGGWLLIDRCEFIGNAGGDLIGLDYNNPNPTKIFNSVFIDNYVHQGMFLGHSADLHLYNCTLVRNSGGYCGGPANELNTSFHNCIIYKDGAVSFQRNYAPFPTRIYFYDTILWDTPNGNGWNEVASSNVIRDRNPQLENPDVAWDDPSLNLAPRPYSPAIDAGKECFDTGTYSLDLAGNARVADNNDDGKAVIDLGAYESLFGATTIPTFQTTAPGAFYAVRGTGMTVPISIAPRVDGSATAVISYPEDGSVTGPETITIANGRGPVDATFSFPRGTTCEWSRITIADAADPAAIAPLNVDFFLSDAIVNAGHIGRAIYLRPGQTYAIPVSIELEGAVAPANVPVSITDFAGTGDNTAAWVGDAFIPAGAAVSSGYLQLTGSSGINTVTLTVGGGFIFAETESDSIEITFVGYPGWMAVDPVNGSDENIVGSLEEPFLTVAHALPLMQAGDTLRMLPGTYSADEVFPWQPGDIALVGYAADGDADRADYVVDGAGTAATAVLYDGIHDEIDDASIANLVFTNFTAAAIQADAATLFVTNAAFSSIYENYNAAGGILLRDSAAVVVEDADFTGFNRAATVFITRDAVNGETSITLKRCRFEDNYSNYGTVANSEGDAGGYFTLADCLFRNNAVPDNNEYFMGDCYRANAIMAYHAKLIQIDRCQFLGGKGGTIIASNYVNPGYFNINDSLFAGNFGVGGVFCGFSTSPDVRNCTFVGNCGGYNVRQVYLTMRNSIICGDAILGMINDYVISRGYYLNPGEGLVFQDTIIWDTPVGDRGYTTNQCVNLQFIDPQLKNVSVPWDDPAFDAHLGASSPARDAGDNAYAARDIDLEGNPRIAYGLPGAARQGGDPIVDLGCYECEIVNLGTMIMLW